MTVYRETSEQIAEAHRQVERVLRLVGESSTEAAAACENLKTKFEAEIQEVKNRYLK
jgi:DnaJ-domain-containing protein 1